MTARLHRKRHDKTPPVNQHPGQTVKALERAEGIGVKLAHFE